jgi:hypothetical protein
MNDPKSAPNNRFFSAFRFSLRKLLLVVFLVSVLFVVLNFDTKNIQFHPPRLLEFDNSAGVNYQLIACEVENAGYKRVWFQSGTDLTSISPKSLYRVDRIPEASKQDRHIGYYHWNAIDPGERILLYLPEQAEGKYWIGIDVKDWIGRRHTISAFLDVKHDGSMSIVQGNGEEEALMNKNATELLPKKRRINTAISPSGDGNPKLITHKLTPLTYCGYPD